MKSLIVWVYIIVNQTYCFHSVKHLVILTANAVCCTFYAGCNKSYFYLSI